MVPERRYVKAGSAKKQEMYAQTRPYPELTGIKWNVCSLCERLRIR